MPLIDPKNQPPIPKWWTNVKVGTKIVAGAGRGIRAIVIQPWNDVFLGCAKQVWRTPAAAGANLLQPRWEMFALREIELFDQFWLPLDTAEELLTSFRSWIEAHDPDGFFEPEARKTQ